VCPGDRNLDDDVVRAIARTGGMVGIGFWSQATCGTTVADIARSIVYVVRCATGTVLYTPPPSVLPFAPISPTRRQYAGT
jgi:hypothetical protein